MLKTFARMILIPMALLFAAAASCFVLVTLGLERVTDVLHIRQGDDPIEAIVELMKQGILLTTGVTIIPALLVILIGELASIRSAIYYIAGGGAALAAVPLLAQFGQTGTFALPEQVVWQVFATAGFAGGFVYWLFAGRFA
jgi:hypothetical protein